MKNLILYWQKLILFFSLISTIFTANSLLSQNVYDTYNPYGSSWPSASYSYGNTNFNYEGEYQLFYNGLNWSQFVANSGYTISYKIEPVSFPFVADCSTGDCGNANSTTRRLLLPSPYNPSSWTFQQYFDLGGTDNELMSNPSRLSSSEFTRIGAPDVRDMLPHTILKHTYYLWSGSSAGSCVLDSFTFVLDHTRGRMSEYPFRADNNESAESEHDVAIHPWIIYPAVPFLATPAQTTNQFNTINYFFYPEAHYFPGICAQNWNMIPNPASLVDQSADATEYGHPSPFSLRGVMLGNAGEEPFAGYDANALPLPGIPHEYYINYNLDLKLINPSERIIYNPSSVSISTPISTPLVFPSGYTFQTVGATYPTAQEVASEDPNNMYGDQRKVYVHGSALHLTDNPDTYIDERQSIYRVMPNAKLVIEPCVTIWDAKIVVEAGATLQYDPTQLYGNVQFEIDPSATVISNSTNQTTACLFNCYLTEHYNAGQILINSNTTWSNSNISTLFPGISPWSAAEANTIRIANGITIMNGATLTIDNNVNLEFGPLAKVIVEPGARLLVNGTANSPCRIGPACQKEWRGIEVWGDRTQGQGNLNNTAQGAVILNHCTIEHALEGLTVGDPSSWGREGGIVKATNCRFLNNVRDVQYLPYRNFSPSNSNLNNLGSFSNCEFKTTEYFFDPSLSLDYGYSPTSGIAHVTMCDVRNVMFKNCVFANDIPQNYKPHLRGVGIYGIDPGVNLVATAPCEFKGLSDGIWIQSSGFSTSSVSITGADFTNNIHGAVMEGTFYTQIMHCTFDVPESPQFGYSPSSLEKGYDKPVGVFMIGATDFLITENNFNVGDNSTLIMPQGDCSDCSYNIVVSESAVDNPLTPESYGSGRIYKNTINHVSMGIQAQGNNGYATSPEGLDVMCNTFDGVVNYDIALVGDLQRTSSVRDLGSCLQVNVQAGNNFLSCNNTFSYDNLYINPYSMNYWYSENPSTIPTTSCANVWLLPCPPISSNGCPSIASSQISLAQIADRYEAANIAYVTENRELDSLLDGGGTENVLKAIEDDSGDVLFAHLSGLSPWLSDTVMKKLLNPTYRAKLNEEQLVEILLTNGGLSTTVFERIASTSPVLSEYHLQLLHQNQSQVGERKQKEQLISAIEFTATAEANLMTSYAMLNDSIEEALNLIDFGFNLTVNQSIFVLQMSAGQLIQARTTLDSIKIGLQNTETVWTRMAELSLSLREQDRSWARIDSLELAVLDSILSVSETSVNARVVVDHYRNIKRWNSPLPLEASRKSDTVELEELGHINDSSEVITIFPNPTTGLVNVMVSESDSFSPFVVQIFSPLGLVIETTPSTGSNIIELDLGNFATGMFYIRVVRNGELLSTKKVMLFK
jgi:hypothetical protein